MAKTMEMIICRKNFGVDLACLILFETEIGWCLVEFVVEYYCWSEMLQYLR